MGAGNRPQFLKKTFKKRKGHKMANRLFQQFRHTLENGIVDLYGSFVTSTSGAIASSACKGFSIAKTGSETGRYTVTLADRYYGLKSVLANIVGTADAAMTSAKGLAYFLRNINMTTGTFDIQFCDPDGTPADAEIENGASVLLTITLKNSSTY